MVASVELVHGGGDVDRGGVIDRVAAVRPVDRDDLHPAGLLGEDVRAGGGHRGVIRLAPSRRTTSPLSIWFSIIASARCAYSSGRPNRDGCGTPSSRAVRTLSGSRFRIGVSKIPGAIVATR